MGRRPRTERTGRRGRGRIYHGVARSEDTEVHGGREEREEEKRLLLPLELRELAVAVNTPPILAPELVRAFIKKSDMA